MTDYPWLAPLLQSWHKAVEAQRLPTAVLIGGIAGLGQRCLAEYLAQCYVCQTSSTDPCGTCQACALWATGAHPDVWRLTHEDGSLKIDAVRACRDGVLQHAQQGGGKVVLIDPAEGLTAAASHALLKILEEPPDQTLFLLVTRRPWAVLPTLRSRCQWWACPTPTRTAGLAWLEQQYPDHPAAERQWALGVAGDAPLAAGYWLADDKRTAAVHAHLDHLHDIACSGASPFMTASALSLTDMLSLTRAWLQDLVRALALSKVTVIPLTFRDRCDALVTQAAEVQQQKLLNFYDDVVAWQRRLQAVPSLQAELARDALLIRWQDCFNSVPLEVALSP